MAGIADVGAGKVQEPEKATGDVTIYFGIFFDGTNNHRLQVLIGKTYRSAKKNSKDIENVNQKLTVTNLSQQERESLEKQRESYYEDELTKDEAAIAKDFTLDIDTNEDYELEEGYAEKLTKRKLELEKEIESMGGVVNQESPFQKSSFKNDSNLIQIEIDSSEIMCKTSNSTVRSDLILDRKKEELAKINEKLSTINRYKWESKVYKKAEKKAEKKNINDDVHTNDFTNIALLEPFYQAKENLDETKEYAYRIYVSGSGTDRDIIDPDNETLKGAGFGQGDTGVTQKVLDAIYAARLKLALFNNNNVNSITLKFHLFGFSRGATAARNFCYVLYKNKSTQNNLSKLFNNEKINTYEIPFLGIYDTVSSIGVLNKFDIKQVRDSIIAKSGAAVDSLLLSSNIKTEKRMSLVNKIKGWCMGVFGEKTTDGWEYFAINHSQTHQKNVKDLGLYATTTSHKVDRVLHICAADEYRENFALVDIKSSIEDNGVEIFIPGAHADVGGGYNEQSVEIKLEKAPLYYEPFTNKYTLLQGEFLFKPPFPQNDKGKESEANCAQTALRNLGWLDNGIGNRKKLIEEDEKLIRFYSGAQKGYSYIGLHLMWEYANKQYDGLFRTEIKSKFEIPSDLSGYKDILWSKIENKTNGKIKFTETAPANYVTLRNKFLHFSTNYKRAKGIAHVNTPNLYEFDDTHEAYTYRRIIYHGEENGSTNMTDKVEDTVFLGNKETIAKEIDTHNENLKKARYDYALAKASKCGGGLK